jgi:hypothetical protein
MRVVLRYGFKAVPAGSRGEVVKTLPKKPTEPTVLVVKLDSGGTENVPLVCTINELVYNKLDLSPIC